MQHRQSHVILQGSFAPGNIALRHDDRSNRARDPAVEAKIEAEWARQQDAARQRGLTLFDSASYRLNTFRAEGDRVTLQLAMMPYRVHAAMKSLYRDPAVRDEHQDKALVVDALLRTKDDYFVFVTVEKVVEEPTSLIGGTCSDSRMPICSSSDLFAYSLERVRAVIRVADDALAIPHLLGLVQNEIGYVHAIFDVRLGLDHRQAQAAFTPAYGKTALITVHRREMPEFLAASHGYVRALTPFIASAKDWEAHVSF
jgi:hypothetical protein